MDSQKIANWLTLFIGILSGSLFIIFIIFIAVIFAFDYKLVIPPAAIDLANVLGPMITVVLTLALVVLYARQTDIQHEQSKLQRHQTELQSLEYSPMLRDEDVRCKNDNRVEILVKNDGEGPALAISLRVEFFAMKDGVYSSENDLGELILPGISVANTNKKFLNAGDTEWFSFEFGPDQIAKLNELKNSTQKNFDKIRVELKIQADSVGTDQVRDDFLFAGEITKDELTDSGTYLDLLCAG